MGSTEGKQKMALQKEETYVKEEMQNMMLSRKYKLFCATQMKGSG